LGDPPAKGTHIVKALPRDPLQLRHAFASFATGVTIITTLDGHGVPAGLTVNSFGSVSLTPPLVQWSLRINSALHRSFVAADRFAVSVLSREQEELARRFSSRMTERFAGVAVIEHQGEPPLIGGAIAHFRCRKVHDYRIGDHELFVGEVLSAEFHSGDPLIFFRSRFTGLVEDD